MTAEDWPIVGKEERGYKPISNLSVPITWMGDSSAQKGKNQLKSDSRSPRKNRRRIKNVEKYNVPEIVEIEYEKTREEWRQLDKVIKDVYASNKMTAKQIEEANLIVADLTKTIRKAIPGARLDLFGSAANLCGSKTCDLDICFRHARDIPHKNTNPVGILFQLRGILQKAYSSSRIKVIECRVPIIKMKLDDTDIDISFYNVTALKNTALFRKYCEWEPKRFPQLVLWTKKWAKEMGINDAHRKTLSSYTITLMIIHFFQQIEPPVFPGWKIDEAKIAKGYDFACVSPIPNWSKNKKSVGELFVGFLDYYSRFNYAKMISIIRRELIDKKDKEFEMKKEHILAVEDPYLPEFNPGYTVNNNKFRKILGAFRVSREVFSGKLVETSWNNSLKQKCMAFITGEELDDYEKTFFNNRATVVEIVSEKEQVPDEVEAPQDGANYSLILTKDRELMSERIFKAVFACRGEGKISSLINQYNRLFGASRSDQFQKDRLELFEDADYSEVFSHFFLKKYLELDNQTGGFRVIDEIKEDFVKIVDSLTEVSRRENDQVESGAKRILPLLSDTMIPDHELFKRFQDYYNVPFDSQEMLNNFGTDDWPTITKSLNGYGIKVLFHNKPNNTCKYRLALKNVFYNKKSHFITSQFIRKLVKAYKKERQEEEMKKNLLVQEISNLDLESGIRRLKETICMKKEPSNNSDIKFNYRRRFGKNFNVTERLRILGKSTFKEIAKLLAEHGVVGEVNPEFPMEYLFSLKEGPKLP